jgi:thioredoxin 2
MYLVCPACSATNRIPDDRLGDTPVCGKCGSELLKPEPISLSEDALPKFIANTELPVLVDFWADWCGPCRAMAPQFEMAAKLAPGIRFVKIDSDSAPATSQRYAIRSIPTLLLFKNGVEVARHSGVLPASEIISWSKHHLGEL